VADSIWSSQAEAEGIEMGEVIAFRKREKPLRRAREPLTGDAQILFFLGVRYVRVEDGAQSQAPGGRPRGGGARKRRA
jgi:hypothetical protein